jgi:curved DNA-binding protein CbpA
MQNIFMKYIQDGRIKNLEELRRVYRRLVLKTHPDTVGSDRLAHEFMELHASYEEAQDFLYSSESSPKQDYKEHTDNNRLAFYVQLMRLERTDTPFNFFKKRDEKKVSMLKAETYRCFREWRKDLSELYVKANQQYDQLKKEKPLGPYRKHALYYNLHPFFHNITAFQVLGNEFYFHQLKQNLNAVVARLEEREFFALKDYLLFLIHDAENGSAAAGRGGER